MEITLGNLRQWRLLHVWIPVCVLVVSFLWSNIISQYIFYSRQINTVVSLFGVFLFIFLWRNDKWEIRNKTFCETNQQGVRIQNSLMDVNIKWDEIEDISYKTIHCGGKWTRPIGYRIIIKCRTKTYELDSVFQKEARWESTELHRLYCWLKPTVF